jgi:hypothetical protein
VIETADGDVLGLQNRPQLLEQKSLLSIHRRFHILGAKMVDVLVAALFIMYE